MQSLSGDSWLAREIGRLPKPDATALRALRDRVVSAMDYDKVMFGGQPSCRVLEAFLIDGSTYDHNLEITKVALRGLRIAVEAQLGCAKLRRTLGVPAYMDEFLAIDAQHGAIPLHGRFDGFVDAGGTLNSFIEFNGAWSGGHLEYAEMNQLFTNETAQKALTGIARVRSQRDHFDRLWQALRDDAETHGLTGTLRIGSPLPEDKPDPEGWLGHMASRGETIIETRVEDFEFDGSRLTVLGETIDYVSFVDLAPILLGDERFLPIRKAIEAGRVRSMQSISFSILVGSKSNFEVLSNPKYRSFFDEETLTILDQVIPWTRVLNERKTDYQGDEIDLLSFVRENKEKLVIKPAIGDLGEGVTLGWNTDDATWEKAIKTAKRRISVVQERAAPPPRLRDVKMFTGEKIHEADLNFDYEVFVWNMKGAGTLMIRATSRDGLLNMAFGDGSYLPYHVVDPWQGD